MKMDALNKVVYAADHTYHDPDFNPEKEVLHATKLTFSRGAHAVCGNIAYLNGGAQLYDDFVKAQQPEEIQPPVSQLAISKHGAAIASDIEDIERLIVIGGGGYNSFKNQELSIVNEIEKRKEGQSPLSEVVLIDVSDDFLDQQVTAIRDYESATGKHLHVLSVRSDFQKISGKKFDTILETCGMRSREDVKAALISTGATFGNLDNPAIDGLPFEDMEKRMARLGEFVGNGSTVIFDYFTKLETAESYYSSPKLAEFFTNIPHIMTLFCGDSLRNFKQNTPSIEDGTYFSYRPKVFANSRMIAHQLIAEQPQRPIVINGAGERVLTIETGEKYTMMTSFRPKTDDIHSRPHENTGLRPDYHVSMNDITVHVCTKVGFPEVLSEDYSYLADRPVQAPSRMLVKSQQTLADLIFK